MTTLSFELRPDTVGEGTSVPTVAVRVDRAVLAGGQGVGPYPDLLLEELRAPIPARAHVRICGCGEPGCWSLVARVRRVGAEIIWDDWRQGVEDEDGWPGESIALPPLRFDAAAYEDEIDRLATLWESAR